MNKDKQTSIRLPVDIYKECKKIAEGLGLTFSSFLCMILTREVKGGKNGKTSK